jgi:UDP-N-acetylglucosamine acyltransferase
MSLQLHSTCIVSSNSSIGDNSVVGPYAIIEDGVVIGKNCEIESHAIIKKGTIIGSRVRVGHFSVLGGDPQFLEFDRSTISKVEISDDVRIGESVTIHRSIYRDGITKIGHGCFLMGNSHVGHDGNLGNEIILANGALLGGHVTVGNFSFIGGGAGVHQFSRIGQGVMVGGLAEISKDVPPCIVVAGRNQACGLNLTGLKRRNISIEEIKALKKVYKSILMKSGNPLVLAKKCLEQEIVGDHKLAKEFSEFFLMGKRGFVRSKSVI